MRAPGAIPAPAAEDHAELEGALRIGRNVSLRLASQAIGALINVGAMVLLGRALSAEGGPRGYRQPNSRSDSQCGQTNHA